jgi:hypothetical protein
VILGGVVQQGGNPHIFIAAVVEHDRCHAQQVRDIWDAALLAVLIAMYLSREQKPMIETGRKRLEGPGG